MGSKTGLWWLPGSLVGLLGVAAAVGGFLTGGPDVVGGLVLGGMALAASAAMLWRRGANHG